MPKAKEEYGFSDTGVGQQILVHMARSCEIVHRCFDQCITNLNVITTTPEEERCMNICALRFAHFIRRTAPKTMELHVAHNQKMMEENQKMMEEMKAKYEQAAAAQEVAAEAPAAVASNASDVNQGAANSTQHQTAS